MKKLITFALIALFAATAGAATQTLAQKHAKAGVRGNPTQEQCIACHGGSYEALAKQTANVKPNPHGSHMGPKKDGRCGIEVKGYLIGWWVYFSDLLLNLSN